MLPRYGKAAQWWPNTYALAWTVTLSHVELLREAASRNGILQPAIG